MEAHNDQPPEEKNLLDLPVEVFHKYILPNLTVNDNLRMRRVSRQMKHYTDGYLWRVPSLVGEVEISGAPGKDLGSFMALGIFADKIFINNPTGNEFYDGLENQVLATFQEHYAPHIRELRVVEVTLYPCFKEWSFLASLVNLVSFEAEYYGRGLNPNMNIGRAREDPRLNLDGAMLPGEWIQGLRRLVIGHNPFYPMYFDMRQRFEQLLTTFTNLEHVCIPYISFDKDSDTGFKITTDEPEEMTMSFQFTQYLGLVQQGHVKTIDFRNAHEEHPLWFNILNRSAANAVASLLEVCVSTGTQILNANPEWLYFYDEDLLPLHGSLIVSIVNMNESVHNLTMDNLQEVDIRSTHKSATDPWWITDVEWPGLRKVKIHVDSVFNEDSMQPTIFIYNFWWNDANWNQVTDLTLSFERGMVLEIPNTAAIVASMPNLTTLKLVNWIGSDEQVAVFWTGLPNLEDITLDSCIWLTNQAIMGDFQDQTCPFLQLQGLKRFSLNHLDRMPRITDRLFTNVIAKLGLQRFTITSSEPLVQVTRRGLMDLAEGRFNETIERFPFQGWSLAATTEEEFVAVGKCFRSSSMM